MTDAVELVICYIEGRTYPRATCHLHHKKPQHAGGGDSAENLVWLSANAHQLVHRAAQLIKANKKGHALDLASTAYPFPAPRQRFLEVVDVEVQSSLAAREAGTGSASVVVEVPIPRADYAKLKLLVADYNVRGKKISISDYVARLVLSHVHKRLC